MSVFKTLELLGEGCLTSLSIFFLTLLFSLPLGFLICFGRMAKNRIVAAIFRVYISVMRGTPLMLQLFVVYYGPYYIFRIRLSRLGDHWMFIAVIVGFVLNYAAYFAEIYRTGIASVPHGQYEAAQVLGMDRRRSFLLVIFPQVMRTALPALGNEVITLVKDTSLAFAIGQVEMFTKAKQLASAQVSLVPYILAAVIYYIFNFAVATALEKIEKRLARSGKR